jgi:regulator of G-protein signaling
MLYSKMQAIAQRMLHSEQGVPIKSYKRRLISAIPSAFTGSDLVVWLMSNLNLDSKEAVHFGRIMVAHGYFFSVEGSVALRDDGTLFRFQTPYYWPSQNPVTTDFEYGVYLVKQVLRSKNKIRLLDYELVGTPLPHTHTHARTHTNIANEVAIDNNCVQSSSLSLYMHVWFGRTHLCGNTM